MNPVRLREMMSIGSPGLIDHAIKIALKHLDDEKLRSRHRSPYVNRRAAAGQCFHRPCLGTREFPADFALIVPDAPLPVSTLPDDQRERDLGFMLHDIVGPERVSHFFRARLTGGVLDVRACLGEGTVT